MSSSRVNGRLWKVGCNGLTFLCRIHEMFVLISKLYIVGFGSGLQGMDGAKPIVCVFVVGMLRGNLECLIELCFFDECSVLTSLL